MSENATQSVGRVLALDLGARRIGLAISDAMGWTAQGLDTLERTNLRQDLARLSDLAAERGAGIFLMGNPLHMSGKEGRQSAAAREFAARLVERSGLPVEFWDERLTTVEAQRALREGGASLERRKRAIDRMAAVLLLESYLEWRAASGPAAE